ncbi:hypothetical protein AC579_1761 [Lecanosticta acicola]|uniref:Protein kinase domain-containing protein n=1 Tax=Lecanosticta acicola TaxID=111012 RepID=A0AAI9E9N2_9PEZI|nr:hypothetical protein AC579_1761 [Lecanosticta acicola]
MASRNYAQVAPTAATIALNAYIFGYGGHSLVTPHAALKRLWWTDERIEAKVTRAFVVSKLRGEEREFLDRPLGFGDLTDDTYMEWILDRAKRLFLILTEVGVPDQIFGCIDDSWDDEDLPIPLENVKSLELSYDNDEALNKRFYDMQFVYLLRELKQGSHIDYGPNEHIPMEHVNTVPPAVCLQPYDRVHFPGRQDDVFMRRKYPMIDRDTGQSYAEAFASDVRRAKALPHPHIASTWASYTTEGAGFILSEFVPEHTLGTFIDHRKPMQLLRVAASERPILLVEWMHCLADAVASLHHRGLAHTQIRPSNIWIDKQNRIAFADIGSLPTFQRNKKGPKTEAYDYAAPEQHITKTQMSLKSTTPPISSMNALSKLRKMSTNSISDSSSATSASSNGSSTRSNSFCNNSPITPSSLTNGRSNSLSTIRTAFSPTTMGSSASRSPTRVRNFSRHLPISHCPSPTIHTAPLPTGTFNSMMSNTLLGLGPRPSYIDPATLLDLPVSTPQQSDMFSLACCFLDLITFLLRGKITDFIKFRQNPTTKAKSFHSEPDRIAAWIGVLEEDSYRHPEQIFRGIPELLRLVRLMMAQNGTLRPTALEVRDRIQDILVGECGIEAICCAGREWAETPKDDTLSTTTTTTTTTTASTSPFRRKPDRDNSIDDFGMATGMLGLPPRIGGGDGTRCASPLRHSVECFDMEASPAAMGGPVRRPPMRAPFAAAEHLPVLTRTESQATTDGSITATTTATTTATARRRNSATSSATATWSSWRNRFLRSA